MVGQIISLVGYGALPANVLLCDGANYPMEAFPDLINLLPESLIVGDGTFNTPDLRYRFILGANEDDKLMPGDIGGEKEHTLNKEEMPIHSHEYMGAGPSVTTVVVPDSPSAVPSASETAPAGGGQPHNNMPPYFVVVYAIVAK